MENCSLLGGSNQFTLLVGVLAAVLTLGILTTRLVDLFHQQLKCKPKAQGKAGRYLKHLSRVTLVQLSIAAAISLRIFLTAWLSQSTFWWFDPTIIGILTGTFIYWIWIHIISFGEWYNWKSPRVKPRSETRSMERRVL